MTYFNIRRNLRCS